MATPKVGADGRRRLTVTVTLFDDDADFMWAAGHVHARGGMSPFARRLILDSLAHLRDDEHVVAALVALHEHRAAMAPAATPTGLRLVWDATADEHGRVLDVPTGERL